MKIYTQNKRVFKLLLICFLLTATIVSCKKEEKKELSPIIGNWEVIKYETSTNGGNWSDANEPCKLDNTELYEEDGSWTLYEGPNKCGSGGATLKGKWKFAVNNTKIIYTYDGFSGEYESNVEKLTSTTLVLIHGAGDVNNTQYKQSFTKK